MEITEERLDKLLVERGLVSNRTRAEQIIRESGVMVNGKLLNKTGKKVPVNAAIELLQEELPYVSRGAVKLLRALEEWKPELNAKVFMDIGASTGGFTEILLGQGVAKVFAVDVGKDQLHPKIKSDQRVVNLEKTHVKELSARVIPELVDGCVIDVSFISLTKIFPFIHPFLKKDALVIVLIKPQFEVGKDNIEKGGIVRNKSLYPIVIEEIKQNALINNLRFEALIDSPILGGDGNREFLGLFYKV